MKSKLVGILFIVTGALFLGSFILSMLMVFADGNENALIPGGLSIFFSIYSLKLGSALRSRKIWAWYAGLTTLSLALIGNLFLLITDFSLYLPIPIILELVSIYAIYSDKTQFFVKAAPELNTTTTVNQLGMQNPVQDTQIATPTETLQQPSPQNQTNNF